jgi:DNA-binding transcriptional LysR family regulator
MPTARVAQHQARPSGTLRVNAPMAFGTLEVAHWLPQFMLAYPEINIDLVCNDRFVDLIDEGFDVALRLARGLPDSSLVAKRLAVSTALLVASPAYLKRHGRPRTPAELAQHNCLTYTLVAKPNEWVFTLPNGERQTVTVQGKLQANTGIALRTAALAGVGIASSTSFIVHDDLRCGDLIRVLPDCTLRPRELYAVYPQSRHLSPKVRAFVDFAAQIYRLPRWG